MRGDYDGESQGAGVWYLAMLQVGDGNLRLQDGRSTASEPIELNLPSTIMITSFCSRTYVPCFADVPRELCELSSYTGSIAKVRCEAVCTDAHTFCASQRLQR